MPRPSPAPSSCRTIPPKAFQLATDEATKNGYTHTATNNVFILPSVDPTSTRRLDVTIKAPVGTFFMRVLGINSINAQRTSKAEFTLPVPMGSPQNYYGVGVLNLPTTTLVGPTSTGYKDASNANNITWVNPTQANSTINTTSGNWAFTNQTGGVTPSNTQQQWSSFDLQNNPNAIPNANNLDVLGIEVRASAFLQGIGINSGCAVRAELSWNNGQSWTTQKTWPGALPASQPPAANPPNTPNPYNVVIGSASDDWGRNWGYNDFANSGFTGNPGFRLRLTFVNPSATCANTQRLAVDTLEVRIWYQYTNINPPQPVDIYDPYGTTVLPPQKFWGGMQSQGAPSVQGDAYMTGYQTRKSPVNARYDPINYYNYGIDMPSAGGEVWLFDPGFCDTAQAANNVNQGTGENWAVSSSNTGGNGASSRHPISAQYELFWDKFNTPYDITDDELVATSGSTFKDSRYYDPNLGGTNPGGGTDCSSTSWHNNWWRMPTGSLGAGRYRLHSVSRIYSAAGSIKGTVDPEDQTDATALNAFAIWTRDDSGTPHVYGLGAMEAYFPLSANFTSTFYLAQIEAAHAGKWMDIDLWDPGDTGALPATLRIMQPRRQV